jgi:hypothetical protein
MYTRVWDNTAPNGAVVDAADIDRIFQELRVDIAERMATVLGNNTFVTTDPVYFSQVQFGVASAKIISGGTAIVFRDSNDVNTNLTVNDDGTIVVRAGITVTAGGLTITAGGATVTAGNVTITAGTFTVSAGLSTVKDIASNGQSTNTPVNRGDISANITLDLNSGNYQRMRFTGTPLTITLSNPKAGSIYVVEIIQDGTGNRSYTWATTIKWLNGATPSPTLTPDKTDVYSFLYNGTDYLGQRSGNNF